jgi:hypothetical protein
MRKKSVLLIQLLNRSVTYSVIQLISHSLTMDSDLAVADLRFIGTFNLSLF